MNILLVYYEPQRSGQTRHVLSLAQGLVRRGHQVAVILPDRLSDLRAAFEQAGARVFPFPLRKILLDPRAIHTLLRQIRDVRAKVVHVHSQEAGMYARFAARLAGVRTVVYTPQTIDIRRTRWHWLYALAERTLATLTTWIVSVNEADRQRLARWGIAPRKLVTVPNGLELDEVSPPLPPPQAGGRVDPEGPWVVQVGRLSEQKDPLLFVEGAALVLRQCPDTHFALAGEGPLRAQVARRVVDLGLEDHVHLLGWQDRALALMATARVVSLTSRWEGSPYTLLEAMACSVPVVATAVNGCPEIVIHGECGFLVPPGDAVAWSERVITLLRDPTLAGSMGRAGRKRVEHEFTAERMVNRIEALYRGGSGTPVATAAGEGG